MNIPAHTSYKFYSGRPHPKKKEGMDDLSYARRRDMRNIGHDFWEQAFEHHCQGFSIGPGLSESIKQHAPELQRWLKPEPPDGITELSWGEAMEFLQELATLP